MVFGFTVKTAPEFIENVRSNVDANPEVALAILGELIESMRRSMDCVHYEPGCENYIGTLPLLIRAHEDLLQDNAEAAKAFLVLALKELAKPTE